jgi:hypothetical protein
MLEREGHYVLDPLEGKGWIVSRESLRNHDFDTTEVISRVPVALREEFVMECWKL